MTFVTKRQKKGISTVLTTLIIVVASVVLGTAVTLFGTSLFQTGAQQQNMAMTNTHVWQGTNGSSTTVEAALVARNSGDKIIAVDTIKIRGTTVPFSSWFASTPSDTDTSDQQAQLAYVTPLAGALNLDGVAGNELTIGLAKQTGPISLDPGKAVIVYVILPKSNDGTNDNEAVSSADVGAAVTLDVGAGQITAVQTVNVSKNV